MKKKSTIVIDVSPRPRPKEEYTEMTDIKPITFYLGNDFRAELKHNIIIHLDRLEDNRLPVAGNCSIILDLYSNRNLSLIGVLKNVLDSCNGLLFSDDKKVESVLVRMHTSEGLEESLQLKLLSSRSIFSVDVDDKLLEPNVIFSMNISTILEDRYLPYPIHSDIFKVADINRDYDTKLLSAVREAYNDDILLESIGLSLNINIYDDNCDIDNIAMNYVKNSTGIIYKDISQIKMLHIKIKNNNKQKEDCKLIIYEL